MVLRESVTYKVSEKTIYKTVPVTLAGINDEFFLKKIIRNKF